MTYSYSAPRNYKSPRHPYKVLHELRARRFALGMTGAQLAERLNIAPNALSDWEFGKHMPGTDGLTRWARALGGELKVEWGALGPETKPQEEKA